MPVIGGNPSQETVQLVAFAHHRLNDDRAGLHPEFYLRTCGQVGLCGVGAGNAECEAVAPFLDGCSHDYTK